MQSKVVVSKYDQRLFLGMKSKVSFQWKETWIRLLFYNDVDLPFEGQLSVHGSHQQSVRGEANEGFSLSGTMFKIKTQALDSEHLAFITDNRHNEI